MTRIFRGATFAAVAILLASPKLRGERLLSPWDSLRVAPTDAAYACPAPPAFSRTLHAEGYMMDKHISIVDPKRLAAFNEASAGPTHLGQFVSRAADAWRSTGSRIAAKCVYSLLSQAAAADAWVAEMPNGVDTSLQNWLLSAAAIAYLKVRGSGAGTPAEDKQIQQWFASLAGQVRAYFDLQRTRPGTEAWNNHMYWAGLSVMAQGVADNDENGFLWGLATYRMGLYAIQPDGSLDAEMARGQKALHYQLYALAPLVLMAELGEANGIPMYSAQHGAIHRLARFDISVMESPSILARRTGVKQEESRPFSGNEIGWAVPYVRRFPNAKLSALIAKAPWLSFWQWGGDPPPGPAPRAKPPALQSHLRESVRAMLARRFPDRSRSAAFFGAWCTEGNAEWRSFIGDAGDYVLLRNESGSMSTAQTQGRDIAAANWSVQGRLSPDSRRIDWNNGTFWTRCSAVPVKTR